MRHKWESLKVVNESFFGKSKYTAGDESTEDIFNEDAGMN